MSNRKNADTQNDNKIPKKQDKNTDELFEDELAKALLQNEEQPKISELPTLIIDEEQPEQNDDPEKYQSEVQLKSIEELLLTEQIPDEENKSEPIPNKEKTKTEESPEKSEQQQKKKTKTAKNKKRSSNQNKDLINIDKEDDEDNDDEIDDRDPGDWTLDN